MAAGTLEAMARGGIHDQLAGGFARYSVDADWVVPHFEKMLYDNALLLRVYAEWGTPVGTWAAEGIADFLLDELRTAEGGFASALDADSEGAEGTYYVWTPHQLAEVLGPDDGPWAARWLSVTDAGTFEHGSSTLQLREDPDDLERWFDCQRRLREARTHRERPARDDKVVAAWNGLAISGLCVAGTVLGLPHHVEAAVAAGELLTRVHLVDGRLRRVSRDGVVGTPAGVLEDYGCVAAGFLDLLQATGDPVWLERAGALLDVALDRFADGRRRVPRHRRRRRGSSSRDRATRPTTPRRAGSRRWSTPCPRTPPSPVRAGTATRPRPPWRPSRPSPSGRPASPAGRSPRPSRCWTGRRRSPWSARPDRSGTPWPRPPGSGSARSWSWPTGRARTSRCSSAAPPSTAARRRTCAVASCASVLSRTRI